MIKEIKKYLTANFAVDIGTSTIKIFCPEKGLILEQPTVVILNGNEIVAIGDKAKSMINKIPKTYHVVYPIKNGKVHDFDVAEIMVNYFMELVLLVHPNKIYKPSPKIIATIGSKNSPVEQRYMKELFFKAGASEVSLIPKSIACALGLNLNIEENECFFIFNIGAGTTELSIISNNEIIESKTIDKGGLNFTEAIRDNILQKENVQISHNAAELLKLSYGTLNHKATEKKIKITGQDKFHNHPVEKEISNRLIIQALRYEFQFILEKFLKLLQDINPDIATDMYKNGVYLVGSGSNVDYLSEHLATTLKLRVNHVSPEDKKYSAVKGCVSYLK